MDINIRASTHKVIVIAIGRQEKSPKCYMCGKTFNGTLNATVSV